MSDSNPPQEEPVEQTSKQSDSPTLYNCPECGVVALPERLAIHDCGEITPTTEYTGEHTR